MKQLIFQYRMDVTFSDPISAHAFTLKCIPPVNCFQDIRILKQQIAPVSWISAGKDSFANDYLYGASTYLHNHFSVLIEGEACVRGPIPIPDLRGQFAWDYMHIPTPLTAMSEEMEVYAKKYADILSLTDGTGPDKTYAESPVGSMDHIKNSEYFRDRMEALMHDIYRFMSYVPGSTNLTTTAATAYKSRCGVCQDYTHIMLAICRHLHIPCAYVAGFMVGEGASHAWVMVHDPRTGLSYELDPTNDRFVNDEYIHVLFGRDADDCKMNKGIYRGFAQEIQEVKVVVKER